MAASTAMSAGTGTSLSVIVYGKFNDLRMRNTATHYASGTSERCVTQQRNNSAERDDAWSHVWSPMQDHTDKVEADR